MSDGSQHRSSLKDEGDILAKNETELLTRAMRLLSQRDHSEIELRRKLAAQPFSAKGNWGRGQKRLPLGIHSNSDGNNDSCHNSNIHSGYNAHDAAEDIDLKAIDEIIAYCYQHNWLDDARFATSYINSRSRKGYGVQRIRSELSQKGIEKELAQSAFEISEIDWCKLAKDVAQRKFGETLPVEWKEKAKVQRYLLYRGFFQEEIHSIYNDFIE